MATARQWAWAGVWLVGLPVSQARTGSWLLVAAFVVGAAVGVVWQVAARRDVAERLTWLAGATLAFGLAVLLDSVIGATSTTVEAGPASYYLAVASAVVITERVLRRRELGPVTRDHVHAPDEATARPA
jgi:hypothetical protein